MKKALLSILFILLVSSTCFGQELTKSQEKILKYYPSYTKNYSAQ